MVGSWGRLGHYYAGAWPRFVGYMGLSSISFERICVTLFLMAHFDYNYTVFLYMSCKTLIFQYMWKYVNMNNICVYVMLVLLFCVLFGGRIWSLRTANTRHHINWQLSIISWWLEEMKIRRIWQGSIPSFVWWISWPSAVASPAVSSWICSERLGIGSLAF